MAQIYQGQLLNKRFFPDDIKVKMPAAGLEPARGYPQQILSLPRLPFRHAGLFVTLGIIPYYPYPGKQKLARDKMGHYPMSPYNPWRFQHVE